MRPSNLESCRGVLGALRRGETSFDAAARACRPALEVRAERFLRVWRWSGQACLGAEDLVQEMTLELWRAVDRWDPARADLVRYVDAQLGRVCQRRLRKVSGYPDPRRPRPVRQVDGDVDALLAEREAATVQGEEAIDAIRSRDQLLLGLVGLERLVVEHVLDGRSVEATTRVIYGDVDARMRYRMDSLRDARRMVGAALRRATTAALGAA